MVTVTYDGTNFQMDSQIATIPTIDINGTAENTSPVLNDAVLIYDSVGLANKKTKLSGIQKLPTCDDSYPA
jgi:hypothetical protein